MRMPVAFLLICLSAGLSIQRASASQADSRLDDLFDNLRSAQSAEQAKSVEQGIWRVWLQSESPTVTLLLSNALEAQEKGDLDKAEALLNALVEAAPDFAEGWNRRATLRFMRDDYTGAVADIQRTLALEPRHFGALAGLGGIMSRLKNDAGALKAYQRLLAVDPQMPGMKERVQELTVKVKGQGI